MAPPPSRTLQALLEPVHLVALALALVLVFYTGFVAIGLPAVGLLEAFYLLVFARSPAYARRIQLRLAGQVAENREQEVVTQASQLRRDERRRFQAIDKLYHEIMTILLASAKESAPLASFDRTQLEQLRAGALEMSLALQTFKEVLAKATPEQVTQELAAMEQQSGATSAAQAALSQTRELMQKRIQHLTSVQAQLEPLERQLQAIEQTFRLTKEQLATLRAPESLPVDVSALVREVEVTRTTVRELGVLESVSRAGISA